MDQSARFDVDEFVSILLRWSQRADLGLARKAGRVLFEAWDTEHSGTISRAELEEIHLNLLSSVETGHLMRTLWFVVGALDVVPPIAVYYLIPRCTTCTEGLEDFLSAGHFPGFLSGIYLVCLCSIIDNGLRRDGSHATFHLWIGWLQGPFDLFEGATLGGVQIASLLYYTDGFV